MSPVLCAADRVCTETPQYRGQRLLISLVRAYRRYLSGRGPLRLVRCTFHGSESCSRYGLRIALCEARTVGQALVLSLARLRRCRESSLYRIDGHLVWGSLYDADSRSLQDELRAARELPATELLLWAGMRRVALCTGSETEVRWAEQRLLHQLLEMLPRQVIRSRTALIRSLVLAITACVVGVSALWLGAWLTGNLIIQIASLPAGIALSAAVLRMHLRRWLRRQRLVSRAAFSVQRAR